MQVNVKELTGVLHLELVFMNVLVFQSFLDVSLKHFKLFQSSISSSTSSCQVFPLCIKCVYNSSICSCMSSSMSSCLFQYFCVYAFLAPTMVEAVMVHSLDLMESYYTLSVSSSQ